MRKLKYVLRESLKFVVYPIVSQFPRNDNQWVFGGHNDRFVDNPKFLFLWMALHRPDIRVTWLTGSRKVQKLLASEGYPVHLRWSPAGIWTALRARVFVYSNRSNDANGPLSRNAFLLNLWHGVGLKAFGLDRDQIEQASTEKESMSVIWARRIASIITPPKPDLFVTTSAFMQTHFSEQVGISIARCPQLGYSRHDCRADNCLGEAVGTLDSKVGFQFNPGEFAEVYLYVPTFRDSNRPFFAEAIPDPRRLSQVLSARNAVLYIKPHPNTADSIPDACNIRPWPNDIDFHPYLNRLTGIITDYSSVLYDYLYLASGGVVLYTFDWKQYCSSDRSLRYDYNDNTVGTRVTTFDILCSTLREGDAAKAPPTSETEVLLERFWGGSAVPASSAIVTEVMRRLATRSSKQL